MLFFYNISIQLFSLAIWIAAPFVRKAKLIRNGRKQTLREVESKLNEARKNKKNTTWVHCASLGEFEQGRPIIDEIREQNPQELIVVTFFSPSGYEVRKDYPQADVIIYLPADSPRNAKLLVDTIKPNRAYFVKYEFWYHYLNQIQKSGAKLYLVSALFQPNMAFFKPWGGLFRKMLQKFSHLFVQDQASKDLLATININQVTVAGDTRFDRVRQITQNAPTLPIVETFATGHKVLVCGSTWAPDEQLLALLAEQEPNTKFIFAPHNVSPATITALETLLTCRKVTRYTQTTPEECKQADILIIDCIGVLSGVYRYGTIAYIGGGFGAGIHNILEAATWGLPIIFGTNYSRFAEARNMIAQGTAKSIANYPELQTAFTNFMDNHNKLSKEAIDFVQQNCGATQTILSRT